MRSTRPWKKSLADPLVVDLNTVGEVELAVRPDGLEVPGHTFCKTATERMKALETALHGLQGKLCTSSWSETCGIQDACALRPA